jgi:hypothetical protein
MSYIWNGEGFDWSAEPPYWLMETSGIAHGLSGDMLGSGTRSIFRGLVFGMTQRDAVTSQAIWRFWDATRIADATQFFGWFEIDGPHAVNVTVNAATVATSAACNFTVTHGEYYGEVNEQCLQPSGPTPGCWAVSYDLATVQAACCADAACAGFSYAPKSGQGCCKANLAGLSHDPSYDGYTKNGWAPPPPPYACILASVWSAYESHAIIFVANWCGATTNVTLSLDWDALGLDAATAVATLPAIDGVQEPEALASAAGPFALPADGGLAMLVAAPAFRARV